MNDELREAAEQQHYQSFVREWNLPIDEDWLNSVGIEYDDELVSHFIYGYKSFPLIAISADEWQYGTAALPAPKTRGDVYLLCRALGIILAEKGDQ